MMKFGIIVFPGSNCDNDMMWALGDVLGQKTVKLWHKDTDLQGCDAIIVPGGFSYGDYLRSGAIARFSPIMQEVIRFAAKGGLVLGICNGFQILTEAGLLPGVLLKNNHQKYVCKNIYIKPQTIQTQLTHALDLHKAYQIPIAHGDGRYYADAATLQQLNENEQVLFRYCDENGLINEATNPNGSLENIAGVCNATKNVFGMMPHPERAMHPYNQDGSLILRCLLTAALAHA